MVARKTNGKTANQAVAPAKHPAITQEPEEAHKPAPASTLPIAGKLTPAQVAEMKRLGVECSEDVVDRHLKIMFWGDSGTRKTETVLRNFPNVLLIDAEGNSDMCVGSKVIPTFQRVKTQDSRKVLEILEAAGKGLIRMPNGEPIETVCIDSVSVLWGVQQEVANSLAEKRAAKYNKALEDANTTQNDWTRAKRPLKAILNRFSKGQIKILVLIAREKDLVKEKPDGSLEKVGLTYDAVKNTHYDMNLTLHFVWDSPEKRQWQYQVTKVQGPVLGETFPDGSIGRAIPFDKLWEFAAQLQAVGNSSDEDESLPDKIAEDEMNKSGSRTSAGLVAYAKTKGLTAQDVGQILKTGGFTAFDPSRWEEMVRLVDQSAHNE